MLQASVVEASERLLSTSQSWTRKNLRPNLFTIGYGKRTTIVFSIGLLKVLNNEEIRAVASHELAHVKNREFFYKALSFTLTAISFFNPLAYVACSTAQREREMFADECAINSMEKPRVLGNALAKIYKAIQSFPEKACL